MNWQGIDVSKVRGGKMPCPKCSPDRKDKRDPCLSVDIQRGLWNCHHCGWKGTAVVFEKREYVKPVPRLEKVGAKVQQFFADRGISNQTIIWAKVSEATEWMPQFEKEVPVICFNYFRNEELVNIKFRGPNKSFKLSKDAELIFYNLDSIQDEVVIVEGEIDCLSMIEAGIFNCVSVPNGASKGNQKLEYLDNCWNDFEGCKKIILAVDNDEAGESLKQELARRLGRERCFTVTYPDGCKDANDVLLKYGKDQLKEIVSNAKDWPIEGIVGMEDIYPHVQEWYENGYPDGFKTGIPGFDEYLRFIHGQMTIITGIPGHGKDEFSNLIMSSLAVQGWTWAVCGFEESPAETATKLVEKITGKAFGFRKNPDHRASAAQVDHAISIIDKMFIFYNTEEIDTDIDGLISKAEELVRRRGIKGFYINPWNWIEHKRTGTLSETEYISECLSKLIRFGKKYGVHVLLLAHTTKMQKDKVTKKYEVPTLYSISGSAHFFNKTHNGITVYRDYDTGQVDVYIQKVKQSWLGKIGFCSFNYDTFTRQYTPV